MSLHWPLKCHYSVVAHNIVFIIILELSIAISGLDADKQVLVLVTKALLVYNYFIMRVPTQAASGVKQFAAVITYLALSGEGLGFNLNTEVTVT